MVSLYVQSAQSEREIVEWERCSWRGKAESDFLVLDVEMESRQDLWHAMALLKSWKQ